MAGCFQSALKISPFYHFITIWLTSWSGLLWHVLTHILCTEIAHTLPTRRLVPAALPGRAAGEDGPRAADSVSTTCRAGAPQLEYLTMFGHRWWLQSLSWQFQHINPKEYKLFWSCFCLNSHTQLCIYLHLSSFLNPSTTFTSHLCQHGVRLEVQNI